MIWATFDSAKLSLHEQNTGWQLQSRYMRLEGLYALAANQPAWCSAVAAEHESNRTGIHERLHGNSLHACELQAASALPQLKGARSQAVGPQSAQYQYEDQQHRHHGSIFAE